MKGAITLTSSSTSFTLCIMVDFPIHIDKLSMELSIVFFKGSQVEFSKSVP